MSSSISWRRSLVEAARFVRDRPELAVVGLGGFLIRGGLIVFLLPIVVLPTPIGLADFIGFQAITAGGLSPNFIILIAVLVVSVAAGVVASALVGAVSDIQLAREAAALHAARTTGQAHAAERRPEARDWDAVMGGSPSRAPSTDPAALGAETTIERGLLLRVVLIRLIAIVPFAIAVTWGVSRLVTATYDQLVSPSDTATPLVLRILQEGSDAAIVVVAMWLLTETIGGLGVRHLVMDGGSVRRALWRALTDPFRRPFTTAANVILGLVALSVVAVPAFVASSLVWGLIRSLVEPDVHLLSLLLATVVFVAAWAAGLALAAVVMTWRQLVGGLEVVRTARPSRVPVTPAPESPGLGTFGHSGDPEPIPQQT
jgi:hypothetical protein